MSSFDDIISQEEYFFDLPDCIFSPDDYRRILDNSFKITNGSLVLDQYSSSKTGDNFEYDLVVNGKNVILSITITSDNVNSEELVEELNKILKKVNYTGDRKFYEFTGGIADFGVAFINEEQEKQLKDNGLIDSYY